MGFLIYIRFSNIFRLTDIFFSNRFGVFDKMIVYIIESGLEEVVSIKTGNSFYLRSIIP